MNPVRTRMVWQASYSPWISYLSTAGLITAPDYLATEWILVVFDNRKFRAHQKYREFVTEGYDLPAPWERLRNQISFGTEQVFDLQIKVADDWDLNEIPKSQRRQAPIDLEQSQRRYKD